MRSNCNSRLVSVPQLVLVPEIDLQEVGMPGGSCKQGFTGNGLLVTR